MPRDPYVQAVRGISIAAVVLIHCLPREPWAVAARPVLNFAVAAFVFLSGCLTPRSRVSDPAAFVRKRAGRVAAPYVAWTVVYLAAGGGLDPAGLLRALAVGGAAQLYYLLVYLQLVLLTPALFGLLDRPVARAALYAVTPATLAVRCALSLASVPVPMQAFCGSWLVFYLLGLEWRGRIAPWLRGRGMGAGCALAALAACLALQGAEGFLWLSLGSFDMATTQLKHSSTAASCCAVVLVALAGGRARRRLSGCRPLVLLGDLSFGVFLCHMAFVAVWGRLALLDGPASAFAGWAFSLAGSCVLVSACRRLLPQGMLRAIGFS